MSDVAESKPDPATNAPEAQKPEETTPAASTEESKPAEEKSVTEAAVDTVKDAATKTSDSVFSMFGGGPKKEKKEEAEDAKDEPSGSSKAQQGEEEVSLLFYTGVCLAMMLVAGCLDAVAVPPGVSFNFFPFLPRVMDSTFGKLVSLERDEL
jgi:hypothetical protein